MFDVMENWVNASGYPLVTVSVRGNNIVLSQVSLGTMSTVNGCYLFIIISGEIPVQYFRIG